VLLFFQYGLHEENDDDQLFSYRSLDNNSKNELYQWMRDNYIPNPVSRNKLHCSVILAKNHPHAYTPDEHYVILAPATYSLGVLGPAYTLMFKSTQLQHQWDSAKMLGARMEYPVFIPHIALTYHIPQSWQPNGIKPPKDRLTLINEVIAVFDPNFAKKNWQAA
jgi:hypothetical protein